MKKTVQARKQRKARYDAPMHIRKKLMNVHVSKSLRAKLGTTRRSMLVKKGDKVKVTTGKYKGKSGPVMEADYSSLKVYVEGVVVKNSKGIEKLVPMQPSNLEILEGDFNSKDRKAMLERSTKLAASGVAKKG
ncbi:MAG: 50S ribosomal protein L24 [Candidatus Micrarchaeia archaeon]